MDKYAEIFENPILILFCVAAISLYSYLILKIADTILQKPQRKNVYRVLAYISNIFFLPFLARLFANAPALGYISFGCIIFAELMLICGGTVRQTFIIATANMIHIMAIRTICLSSAALYMGVPSYSISRSEPSNTICLLLTFVLADIIAAIALKFMPTDKLRTICSDKVQSDFICRWLIAANLYLLFNSYIFTVNNSQIVSAIAEAFAVTIVLSSTYGIFILCLKFITKAEYEAQNGELFKDALLDDSIGHYEFNVSRSEVGDGFELATSDMDAPTTEYNKVLSAMAEKYIHPDDRESFLAHADNSYVRSSFESHKRKLIFEYRKLIDDEYVWVRSTTHLALNSITGDINALTYVKNIDQEKKENAELQFKAERDFLTGLYNKGASNRLISDILENTVDSSTIHGVLVIDIDNFKLVNDTFGHAFGDTVLQEVGEIILSRLCSEDVVGRIGGDEFIAFVRSPKTTDDITKRAREICESCNKIYRSRDGKEYRASASIGVAFYPTHGVDFDSLYRNADTAMYNSKQNGKNSYSVFSSN